MQMLTPAASVWSAAQEKLQAKEVDCDHLQSISGRQRGANGGGEEANEQAKCTLYKTCDKYNYP